MCSSDLTSLGGVAVTNGRSGATLAVSDRQQQVLSLIREGLTNRAIAARLGFAEGTIKADITAMSSLLGASGRDDLVAKAARAGL